MLGLGVPELIILATILMAAIVPAWLGARVAKKAGFHRAWSLLLLFIPLHVVLLRIFAFMPSGMTRPRACGQDLFALAPGILRD